MGTILSKISPTEWKPRKVLEEIQELCKGKRSLKTILPIITEKLNANTSDFKKFSFRIDGHSWQGYIYLKRNSLMGSLFSLWDNKFFIIRGYPKIKYVEDSSVLNKEATIEFKLDGTNLGIWLLPNSSLMGKTRLTPRWDVLGYQGRNWYQLWKEVGIENNVIRLLKEDYQIFGELFGSKNAGDFIRYTVQIDFKIFDILDRRTLGFVSRREKERLCSKYDLPLVDCYWEGILTRKEAERIEFEAKQFVKEDGYEGFVGKLYSEEDKDVHFCKLKCKEVREKCWELSSSTLTIPSSIIAKAIRKAMENLGKFSTKEEFENFVIEELREEASEQLISSSKDKIKRMIYERLTPQAEEDKIIAFLEQLEKEGINLLEKGKVMKSLANKFIGSNPSLLFNIYQSYLIKRGLKS